MTKYKLTETFCGKEETAFTLVNQAYIEQERKSCPQVGLATDRRSLRHLGEVFFEENVEVLMCFVCGCKHIHHKGFDKFGEPYSKATIAYRRDVGDSLRQVLIGESHKESWNYNFSAKRFKAVFADAVKTDPFLQEDVFEWKRKVQERDDDAMCNAEDVRRSSACKHDDRTVCSKCDVPICNDCWRLARRNAKIPKALTNDNIISYAHQFLVAENVTWLEATIACPVFSGLITYYIEGDQGGRHNLMQVPVGQAQKSWAVRGNLFSFLLPWEQVLQQLFEKIEDGNLSEWPLAPEVVRQSVRVSFVRGPESILSKFKELLIRSWVVKKLARIYIESNVHDLADRAGVLKIHAYERCASIIGSLKQHADRRVDQFYPPVDHDTDTGAILPGLLDVVAEQRSNAAGSASQPISTQALMDSVFDMKQSTTHDSVQSPHKLFEHARPSIVTDEGASANTYAPEVVMEQGLSNVANMQVRMSNEFQDQFVSKYMLRIFRCR